MSYVTLEEAEQLVLANFRSTSLARVQWDGMSDEDKQVCLNQAFRAIEGLPFTGRKSDPDQPTQFPRFPDTDVPEAVRVAQVLLAVSLGDPETEQSLARYHRMRVAGVSSMRLGNFSEVLRKSDAAGFGLQSPETVTLLKPWLDGSFRIV